MKHRHRIFGLELLYALLTFFLTYFVYEMVAPILIKSDVERSTVFLGILIILCTRILYVAIVKNSSKKNEDSSST